MTDNYFVDKTYHGVDFTEEKLQKGEYDTCRFVHCNFEGIHASNIQFVGCEFVECNFSNTIVKNTAFKEVQFLRCKMIGVKFNECDPFLLQMNFKECQLNFSSFYQLKLPKATFSRCSLQEVDFTQSDFISAVFDNCDLKHAIFEKTNLEKTNFITSEGFTIDPEKNRIVGAKFSKDNVVGLLMKYGVEIE